jgi:hypothetical protein
MAEPKVLKLGDPCPACGGDLKAAPVPSDEQFRKAFDRENPIMLPPGMDTAKPEDRAELGALHSCGACGYKTRFKSDEKPAKKRGDKTDDK